LVSLYSLIFLRRPADHFVVNTADHLIKRELMLNRFNRLMGELARGLAARNTFEPWEIEILLDMQTCQLEPRRRTEILRQYQRAVERQLEVSPGPPIKLSQFLIARNAVRDNRRSA